MKKFFYYLFVFSLLLTQTSAALADYGIQTKISGCTANQAAPDSACTPGAVLTTNTKVICRSGYTKTVRNVPLSVRKNVFAEYGIPYRLHGNYEVDHLISLELGGSNDISNLWPESYLIKNGARIKDKLENRLHAQACAGKITIAEAQAEISSNWLQYYIGVPKGSPKQPTVSVPSTVLPIDKATPAATQDSTSITVPNTPTPAVTTDTTTPTNNSSIPQGATARCVDGTYSFSTTRSGTCSHHGGAATWY